MSLHIDIRGVDQVIRKLGTLRGPAMLRAPMEAALAELQGDLKVYPSPPQGSRYRRTGTLGRGWTTAPIQTSTNGVTGRIGTRVRYAPWVQGKNFQAGIHRGRWSTDAQVLERRRAGIVARFEAAIRRALGR